LAKGDQQGVEAMQEEVGARARERERDSVSERLRLGRGGC
jgi:hypothetical protein